MAVKTITIDMEAYGLLSLHKTGGRSFSEVIKAHFEPQPTVGRFKAAARATRISQETLDIMDEIVRARANEPARAAR
jgi:predicted CopG family antitoxin